MSSHNHFTKIKVTIGYVALLAVMYLSLWFIYQEFEHLSSVELEYSARGDSLLGLLRQKDENTIEMLKELTSITEEEISIEEQPRRVVEKRDTAIVIEYIPRERQVLKIDTIISKPRQRRGFFKRLTDAYAEVRDTSYRYNSVTEYGVDTVLREIPSVRRVTEQQQYLITKRKTETFNQLKKYNERLVQMNQLLTERIDTLMRGYEEEIVSRLREESEAQKFVQERSIYNIGLIAIGSIILCAFFLIIIWRDITRSNQYRKELEKARAHAEELLKAREKLMLTITHDFKAPLGSIIGYIDLLSRLIGDEREKFYLDNMRSSSRHLLKLVNDLLDFHRLDLNKMEMNRVSFNPAQLFEEVKVSFEPLTADKGLSLNYEIDESLNGRYISDPLRIRQITDNLLSNAVKFTSEGSITLAVHYNNSQLIITVKDTGQGIRPEEKENIFLEFTRLSSAQGEEGLGLGLSIVLKLIHMLEGSIKVESEEGNGSCFIVEIPLYPVVMVKEVAKTVEEPEMPSLPPLRVLLIDDDKIQLNLTSAMLQQQDIRTVCCEQLEELTEYLRRETFDVLLTDVQMPAINGFDLLKVLRNSSIPQARTIPIIAVTARGDITEKEFLNHGFAARLNKPFSLRDLMIAIGRNVVNNDDEKSPEPTGELNFAALTSFSEGDEEASRSIINTFIVETKQNAETMRKALEEKEVTGITNMAHKMLPLFTLINASEATAILHWLEEHRDKPFSDKIGQKAGEVLEKVSHVLEQAELL